MRPVAVVVFLPFLKFVIEQVDGIAKAILVEDLVTLLLFDAM
jgi:hypothetical protein